MELGSALSCPGCGSTNVNLDSSIRKLICYQCGGEHYYSRSQLNANNKVAFSRENAIKFFAEGKMDNARHYALEILSISKDNAPALYIIAYYDEFVVKRAGALKDFFYQIDNIPLEYDEIQELRQLILSCAVNLLDFEADILRMITSNQKSPADSAKLCEFIDLLCPYFIKKRSSIEFFHSNLIEMYKDLAQFCSIPKTCFALLKAIDENPDSPYSNNSFYLTSKAHYFYQHFLLPTGEIINAIASNEMKQKLLPYYLKRKEKYMEDAKIEERS